MNVLQTMVDVSKYVLTKYLPLVALATRDIDYIMRSFVQVNHNFINQLLLNYTLCMYQILMSAVKEHQVVLSYVLTLLVVIHVLVIMVINSLMIITLVLILMSVFLIIMEGVNKHVTALMVAIIVPVLVVTPLMLMVTTVQVYIIYNFCGLMYSKFRYQRMFY